MTISPASMSYMQAGVSPYGDGPSLYLEERDLVGG